MKKLLFSYKFLFISILIIFLPSCTSNDVGDDTDGPAKEGFPIVTTRTIIVSDEGTSAESGGEITSAGDSEVISRGVCWSKGEHPTINDFFTQDGKGTGEFTSIISELEENTQYYLRSYASNKFGTSYGGEIDFFTGKIYRGDVTLSSQEEVDIFGAENYLIIIGNVFIGKAEGSDIANLKALNNLNQIRGDLSIGDWKQGNPLLKNLEGLEYLALVDTYYLNDYIPKKITIGYNDQLENIDALSGLSYFNGAISISRNPALKNIDAFSRITNIEDIHIFHNSSLTNLNGLSNATVKGIFIGCNPKLTSLGDLNTPSKVSRIIIRENSNLSNISSLSNISEVEYSFWIINNPLITNIDAFRNLETIGKTMEISGLGITSLTSLNSLISVAKTYTPASSFDRQHLKISENKNLNDFCGIKTLFSSDFKGEISIKNNLYNPSREDIVGDKCNNI